MSFRSDKLTSEFKQSIVDHAVASGRDANCFFQSFFHTLTAQNSDVLNLMKREYEGSIDAFVHSFNKNLSLEPPVDFDKIIQISKALHPLERECVFGPILRQTYNNMLKSGLILGTRELPCSPDAIVFHTETAAFSKAFGVQIFVYMDQDEFERSIKGGMPEDVAKRVAGTKFDISGKNFYCDHTHQKLAGKKTFDLNIVFAGMHLNYTLGESKRNNEHRKLIVTKKSEFGGIFADSATDQKDAPLSKLDLTPSDIANELCVRFSLTRSDTIQMQKERQSTIAHVATLLRIPPSNLQVVEEKNDTVSHLDKLDKSVASSKTPQNDLPIDEISDEEVARSAFGKGSDTAKKIKF